MSAPVPQLLGRLSHRRHRLKWCDQMTTHESILDHPAVSGRYLFPQPRYVNSPFTVAVDGAELACYRQIVDPESFTMVHFHGNGEAVADYVPDMADAFAAFGLNSLFVDYREYGGSTGKARLVAMLGDGEAAIKAAGLEPDWGRASVCGHSSKLDDQPYLHGAVPRIA